MMEQDIEQDDPMRSDEVQALELSEYIQAFRSSSDRARYVIFVNIALSLLIFIGSWNLMPWSAARREINEAMKTRRAELEKEFDDKNPLPGSAQLPAATESEAKKTWEERRKQYVDQKLKEKRAGSIEQSLLPPSMLVELPQLGLRIYVSDLGILGGLPLAILSLILCLSMIRQHENLYLATFKIMRLRERESSGKHQDGESMANFLYHALAMAQVLNYPPTLARWGYGYRNRLAGAARWVVFMFPFVVLLPLFLWGLSTREADLWPITVTESLLLVSVGGLSALAAWYSRTCNSRWRRAFEAVNPGLQSIEQRKWRLFMKVKKDRPEEQSRFLRELTYTFQPSDTAAKRATVIAEESTPITSHPPRISQDALREMAAKVYDKAKKMADTACRKNGKEFGRFVKVKALRNVIVDSRWIVAMECSYEAEIGGIRVSQKLPPSPPPPPLSRDINLTTLQEIETNTREATE